MIATLVRTELRDLLRGGRARVLLLATALLLLAAAWSAAEYDTRQRAAYDSANEAARADWLEQDATTAHGMAHFGDFAFRPSGPLARLDGGVQAYLGRVLRLEGHRRGSAVHSAAGVAGPLLRFGRLEPAFVLQILLPLLLVFLGAGMVAGERESGRLKLSLVQGATPFRLLLGKTLALWCLGSLGLALVLAVEVLHDPAAALGEAPGRLLGLSAAHLAFLGVVACLTIACSAFHRRAAGALSVLLIAWTLGSAVSPRVTARVAAELAPLPSRDTFESALREARAQGMDGHNPMDARVQQLQREVLAEYGVSSVAELPINFNGLVMQADEEFGNEIWDEHFGGLAEIYRDQARVGGLASFLNPFQAIDAVSMALAGTDLFHDLHFQEEAEGHRRAFVGALNREDAYGKHRAPDGRTEAGFFAGLEAFHYEPPPLGFVLATRGLEAAALGLWVLLGLTGLGLAARGLRSRSVA